MRQILLCVFIALLVVSCNNDSQKPSAKESSQAAEPNFEPSISWPQGISKKKENMVLIPNGDFMMGAVQKGEYRREYPAHPVRVDAIYMDSTEVSNGQFLEFVESTDYKTIAEREIDWEELKEQLPPGTPKPEEDALKPGSLIFSPPKPGVALESHFQWWDWKVGANWRNPNGDEVAPELDLNLPVIHVAYLDAEAYCEWKGKRLPTEAEWEFAARGGLEGQRFVWGNEDPLYNDTLANIWQGEFPRENAGSDGYIERAPVGAYHPNGYGLYNMAGNVWEWCSDLFHDNYYKTIDGTKVCYNPIGPNTSYDPRDPYAKKRVIKGGSFLCHVSYCENYRPSAREGSSEDTGMPHVGFRCVQTLED